MEKLKMHSKVFVICSVIFALIIVWLAVRGEPIDFNELYSDLGDEYWCEIADDGSWIKITLWRSSVYLDHVESINEDLGFSSAVYEEMMDTRAIDGRLTAKGENVKASWSYDGSELSILYEADGNIRFFDKRAAQSEYFMGIFWLALVLMLVIGAGYLGYSYVRKKEGNPENDSNMVTAVPLVEHSSIDSVEVSSGVLEAREIVDREKSDAEVTTTESEPASSDPKEADFQKNSPADELLKWKQLLDMGVITQEEFEAKKKELLGL